MTAMMDPNSPAPKIQYPEWQHEYQAALLELDPQRLKERLEAAEAAIFKQLKAMPQGSDCQVERQAIEDAVSGLRVLKRDSLGFPDWEKK